MSLRASDLQPETKRQLLRSLREQMGTPAYRDAVGRLGEDGLIALAFQSIEGAAPKKKVLRWPVVLFWALVACYLGLFLLFDSAKHGHTGLSVLVGVFVGGLGGAFAGPAVLSQPATVATMVCAGIAGAVAGAVAGWTGSGSEGWFGAAAGGALVGWLLDRFIAWVNRSAQNMRL